MPTIARRSRASTCAAQRPTPVAASWGLAATTRPAKSCATESTRRPGGARLERARPYRARYKRAPQAETALKSVENAEHDCEDADAATKELEHGADDAADVATVGAAPAR